MPRHTSTATIVRVIHNLRSERQQLQTRLADIDATFEQLGISAEPSRRRGRRQRSTTSPAVRGGRRQHGQYAQTAGQFLLGLLLKKKQLTTTEINKAWTQAGRPGNANGTLMKLVKAKKLKRRKIRGGKGSRYQVA